MSIWNPLNSHLPLSLSHVNSNSPPLHVLSLSLSLHISIFSLTLHLSLSLFCSRPSLYLPLFFKHTLSLALFLFFLSRSLSVYLSLSLSLDLALLYISLFSSLPLSHNCVVFLSPFNFLIFSFSPYCILPSVLLTRIPLQTPCLQLVQPVW
mgnify:CR=1 FL=1